MKTPPKTPVMMDLPTGEVLVMYPDGDVQTVKVQRLSPSRDLLHPPAELRLETTQDRSWGRPRDLVSQRRGAGSETVGNCGRRKRALIGSACGEFNSTMRWPR